MTVFDLEAILRLDKSQYEQGLNQAETSAEGMGNQLSAKMLVLANLATDAIKAFGNATISLAKDTLESYGSYEQLVGGVETLFGTGGKSLAEFAETAKATAQDIENSGIDWEKYADAAWLTVGGGFDGLFDEIQYNLDELKTAPDELAEYLHFEYDLDTEDAMKAIEAYQNALTDESIQRKFEAQIQAQEKVMENAANAYQTAGLSANEYMETVTSFSAALIKSLGGDTQKAAEYADMAITDMSDNANKMGSSMESIQNAYQGFAKQNYTMLDNLKLGYGGTKEEMERLIADAEELDESFVAARDSNGELTLSYADVVDAIHIVQTQMGITGTTAKEAATTIEGSVSSMKASWKNLITGLGNTNADLSGLVNQFTASFETVAGNVLPILEQAINSMSIALPQLISNLLPQIITSINNMLPSLISAATGLVNSFVSSLPTIVSGLINVLPNIIKDVLSNIGTIVGNLLPSLAESLAQVLANLPAMLAGAVGGIVDGLTNVVSGIMNAVKVQAEASIPDDIADGYVGKVKSNFERTFSDGWLNLQSTVAQIFGDTNWQNALESIKLASELQDKIVDDYNTAKDKIAELSFENFELETQANINTAMSLLGALNGMIDDEGNITTDLAVVQTYIDKINEILGEGAVNLRETPAEWIIKIADKYKDADGNIKDPDALRQEIENELNSIFGGEEGTSIDLNEQTYNAVSTVLSGYTYEQALLDKNSIKTSIEDLLVEAGVPEVQAKAIANASIEEGAISTWYGTASSTSWDNSSFIKWMQDNDYLPDATNPEDNAKSNAVAEIMTSFIMGDTNYEEFTEQLDELKLTDEEKNQIIRYTVDTSQVQQAIRDYQELTRQKYISTLVDVMTDSQIAQWQNYSTAVNGAKDAQEGLDEQVTGSGLSAFIENVNGASLAMEAQREIIEDTYSAIWNLDEGIQGVREQEEYVSDMLENDTGYQTQKAQVDELKDSMATYAGQLVETAGGYDELSGAEKTAVDSVLSSVSSWDQAASVLGLTSTQTTVLSDALSELSENGFEPNISSIGDWIYQLTQSQEGVEYLAEVCRTLGITSTGDLGIVLAALAGNEELVTQATDILATSAENAATAVDDAGDAVGGMADEITGNVSKVQKASQEIADAAKPPIDETEFEEQAEGAVAATANGMRHARPKVSDESKKTADAMLKEMENLPSDMKDTGDDAGSSLDTGFGNWKSAISDTVDDTYEFFYNTLGTLLPPLMSQWGSDASQKFNSGLNIWTTDISNTVQEISDSVYNPLNSLSWQLHSAGYQAGSDFVDGLTSATGDLYSTMYDIGYYAGEGIYNGLSSWSGTLSNLAWNMAADINNAAREALDIQSPSRVLMQTMDYAGEGMYIGLSMWQDTLIGQAETISYGIAEAIAVGGESAYNELITLGTELTGTAQEISYNAADALNGDEIKGFGFNLTRDSVSEAYDKAVGAGATAEEQIVVLLREYLPKLADKEITIDGNKLVGAIMPKIDKEYNKLDTMAERGVTYA